MMRMDNTAELVRRLTPIDRQRELLPWRRAGDLTRCFLYWIPVNSFPAPVEQRAWLLHFFERLSCFLKDSEGLREEVFFQFKAFNQLRNPFLNHQREFYPMIGLSRRPGAPGPKPASEEEISAMGREMLKTMKPPDVTKYIADYCYWFVKKAARKQRELFLGHAALTMLFLKPDPKTASVRLPPQFQFLKERPDTKDFDLEGMIKTAVSLQDGFLSKSKQLFGAGLEDDPQFKGLLYVVPLLQTSDFFSQPEEEAKKWFELFDVYINESPPDKGILMAFKNDFEEQLVETLAKMKEEGLVYKE
jgi:hypothetical protein